MSSIDATADLIKPPILPDKPTTAAEVAQPVKAPEIQRGDGGLKEATREADAIIYDVRKGPAEVIKQTDDSLHRALDASGADFEEIEAAEDAVEPVNKELKSLGKSTLDRMTGVVLKWWEHSWLGRNLERANKEMSMRSIEKKYKNLPNSNPIDAKELVIDMSEYSKLFEDRDVVLRRFGLFRMDKLTAISDETMLCRDFVNRSQLEMRKLSNEEKFKEAGQLLDAYVRILPIMRADFGGENPALMVNLLKKINPESNPVTLSHEAQNALSQYFLAIRDEAVGDELQRKRPINGNLLSGYLKLNELVGDHDIREKNMLRIYDIVASRNPRAFFDSPNLPYTDEVKIIINKLMHDRGYSGSSFESQEDNLAFTALNDLSQLHGERFNHAFNTLIAVRPDIFYNNPDLPYTPEQRQIVSVLEKIYNSPSKTMKNMAAGLAKLIVQSSDLSPESVARQYEKIEDIYVGNNLPHVGKQFLVFEILYPDDRFKSTFKDCSSPELLSLHSLDARRLMIFKDLMNVSFSSLNSDLEQYLRTFRDGQQVLDKYESGEQISEEEKKSLKTFFRRINRISENTRKRAKHEDVDKDEMSIEENHVALRKNFGALEGEKLTDRFNRMFLQRAGFVDINEAIDFFERRKEEANKRNLDNANTGVIAFGGRDLAKSVPSEYLDQFLDKGIVTVEFVGAETEKSKYLSEKGDQYTPWDADVMRIGNKRFRDFFEKGVDAKKLNFDSTDITFYGDIAFVIKDRGQFKFTSSGEEVSHQDRRMELFHIGYDFNDHYGIRTGFGSTEIDAIVVKNKIQKDNKKMDELKFSIAKKGFYIPLCDVDGKVIFTPEEFDEYRKIFRGIDRYHGDDIEVSEDWKQTGYVDQIKDLTPATENLSRTDQVRSGLYGEIQDLLAQGDIPLHKGRNADTIIGAQIVDTGSTGRGSSMDEGFDFDFVVKVDDYDFDNAVQIIEKLKEKYPFDHSFDVNGMRTFRFKGFEKDGQNIDLDLSFVRKSDSEDLDANEAVSQKYDSIRAKYGEDKFMEVLANVRFAKKHLKRMHCYKKGEGQEGGLGGIGVENWVLKNGGDSITAFRDFYSHAYEHGSLISFEDFKKRYKVFGAGENIRGGIKAENFVDNMSEEGYKKMAKLAKEISEKS